MVDGIKLEEFLRLRELARDKWQVHQPQSAVKPEPISRPPANIQEGIADYYKHRTYELRLQAGKGLPVRKMGNFVDVRA